MQYLSLFELNNKINDNISWIEFINIFRAYISDMDIVDAYTWINNDKDPKEEINNNFKGYSRYKKYKGFAANDVIVFNLDCIGAKCGKVRAKTILIRAHQMDKLTQTLKIRAFL